MFDAVFGHAQVKTILERMFARDQLHHGLCFHGPSGIGKRLMAREVARAMLCENRTGCDTCRHCHKFKNNNHPDYQEITPDGLDIKVQQIREVSENLHFKPFEGRARIIVLDRAERLRKGAANAFLKSLEEPPDYVYFILVTADLSALLPTIRSRCQKIAFQSLKDEDKKNILITRFQLEPGLAGRLASISFRQLETDEEAWQIFLEDLKTIIDYFKLMLAEGHALDLFNNFVRDKKAFPRFLDHLTATARELTWIAAGMPGQPLFDDFREDLNRLATQCDVAHWRDLWQQVNALNGQLRRNLNHGLWFNALSVTGLGTLTAAEEQLRSRLGGVRR